MNPLTVSAINALYECAIHKIVDHVEGARILRQSKQISLRQPQNFRERDANHAGVGNNEDASTRIRGDNLTYLQAYALLERAQGLGAGDRLARKMLCPLTSELWETPRYLLPG
jgi:hypothetical protein